MRTQSEVIVFVPREARQVEHNHAMHTALVQATEREQVLKLAAVRRLRALTFLVEAFQDLVALTAAVFLAGAKLGRQAEILGLLFVLTRT